MTLSDFIEELNTAIKQDGYSIYCNADTAKMIKSLLTSEMNDLISRQALYEILDEYDEGKIYWGEAEDRIGNLPSVQPEQRWTPVSERPPEIGHNVLISTIYGSVGEGEYKGFDGYHHKWIQYRWTATLWDDEVIAWMPLPER